MGPQTRRTPRADCTSSTTTAGPKWSSRYWTPTRWDSRRRQLSSRLTGCLARCWQWLRKRRHCRTSCCPIALLMSDLADAGLHDVAVDRCSEFVSALQQQDLRHGAMLDVLAGGGGG